MCFRLSRRKKIYSFLEEESIMFSNEAAEAEVVEPMISRDVEEQQRETVAGFSGKIDLDSYGMSFLQEVSNAFSLLVVLNTIGYLFQEEPSVGGCIIINGALVHFPVAFTYHMGCAYQRYQHRLNNDMCRLDQSLQHFVTSMYAFALSASWYYVCAVTVYNSIAVSMIWLENSPARFRYVFFACILYLAPVLWQEDYLNLLGALVTLSVGGAFAFIPYINIVLLRGWGHTCFHFFLCGHVFFVMQFAKNVKFEGMVSLLG